MRINLPKGKIQDQYRKMTRETNWQPINPTVDEHCRADYIMVWGICFVTSTTRIEICFEDLDAANEDRRVKPFHYVEGNQGYVL